MVSSPTNKALMIFFLGVLACYAAWIGDKTTLAMIAGAFIALLKQED
jgi:hypothetical protein